jgi:hypothetical protein
MKLRIAIRADDPRTVMAVLRRERKARELSLGFMAASMGTYDHTVQRMEEAADDVDPESHYAFEVDRLKAYVKALGGTLRIEVELP